MSRFWTPSRLRAAIQNPEATLITGDDRVLQAAESRGVDEAIFVRLAGDIRAPAVFVTAVSPSTRRVQWIGNAWYRSYVSQPFPVHVVMATCRALEAAWHDPEGPDWGRCTNPSETPHRATTPNGE
ncbi:hypothetical protein YTPLAS18_15230 [Nitrospira sp.]|nr:hypothetical protein YTPLAS18_15230 [Nitrospira sp.]